MNPQMDKVNELLSVAANTGSAATSVVITSGDGGSLMVVSIKWRNPMSITMEQIWTVLSDGSYL